MVLPLDEQMLTCPVDKGQATVGFGWAQMSDLCLTSYQREKCKENTAFKKEFKMRSRLTGTLGLGRKLQC